MWDLIEQGIKGNLSWDNQVEVEVRGWSTSMEIIPY